MKLLTKYTRLNAVATTLIFIVGSCVFYFFMQYVVVKELDQTLFTEQQEITEYAKLHDSLPEIEHTKDQHTTYRVASVLAPTRLRNVQTGQDADDGVQREINFTIEAGGKNYLVTVSKPLSEAQNTMQWVMLVTIGMIGLMLFAGYFINRILLSKLWKPFNHTVQQVQAYNVSDKAIPKLEATNIDEFALLNQSILQMANRVQGDYQSLKEFTSHAAHEMQTSLSIIRLKLDMLMQNEFLLEHNPAQIPDIEKAVNKLSKLYQSLLLLTKVENRLFELNESVSISEIIQDKHEELSEMLEAKDIQAVISTQPLEITFHKQLTEIIIGNLLYNAIRYNLPGGEISTSLEGNVFKVSNTSLSPKLDTRRVFQRFYRHADVTGDGNGLGLSIVKQICDMAGFVPGYAFEGGRHVFSVSFATNRS